MLHNVEYIIPGQQLVQTPQTTSTIMPPPLSSTVVDTVISLAAQGLPIAAIRRKTGVSSSQISKLRSQHLPGVPKAKGGRSSLLTPHDIRHTTRLIETGQADTAVEVHQAMRDTFLEDVSVQTIRRVLKRQGMLAVTKRKRPTLTKAHRAKRYQFALEKKSLGKKDVFGGYHAAAHTPNGHITKRKLSHSVNLFNIPTDLAR